MSLDDTSWQTQNVSEDIRNATHFINCVYCFMSDDEEKPKFGVLSKYLQGTNLSAIKQTRLEYEVPFEYAKVPGKISQGSPFEIVLQFLNRNLDSFSKCLEALTLYSDPSDWIVCAVYLRRSEIKFSTVTQLLELGASPNASHQGITCLQMAVDDRDREVVKALLDAGADPNKYIGDVVSVVDEEQTFPGTSHLKGSSPLWLCTRHERELTEHEEDWDQFKEIESMLRDKGARAFCTPTDGTLEIWRD